MGTPSYDFHYPALAAFTFVVSIRDKEGNAYALPEGAELACGVQAGESAVSATCDYAEGALTVRVPKLYAELPPMRRQCFYTVYLLLNGGASPLLTGQMLLDPLLPSPAGTVTGESVELVMRDERIVLNASVCIGAQGQGSSEWDGGTITVPTTCDKVSLTVGDPNGEVGINGSILLSPDGTLLSWHGGSDQATVIQGSYISIRNRSGSGVDLPDDQVLTKKEVIDVINSIINP